ncbi:MAG: anti-sigma F factor [Betaproteobacteria bacterium HGW-Betaproteobacteria-12]|nr:MAG: anti-sigma F factor [Betaproteobacteria bacterium HGW-Betaproteobacteria-12]
MKTDELVALLAAGESAVNPHAVERRYALALSFGLPLAGLLMATLLKLRPDLSEAVLLPAFWIKAGFVASLAGAALFAVLRLSRPGARLDRVPALLAAPVLVIWSLAAYALFDAPPQQRSALFFGTTWKGCPLVIAVLSVPLFAGVMWAMKGLAPTHTRFAGFAAGLLSGASAALIYSLHCPEMAMPFIGFWYLLGILIPAVVGTLLSNRLLRW